MATFKNTNTNRTKAAAANALSQAMINQMNMASIKEKETSVLPALPKAYLVGLNSKQLGTLTPEQIGWWMFEKKHLNSITKATREKKLGNLSSYFSNYYWNTRGNEVVEVGNCLVDDADLIVRYMKASLHMAYLAEGFFKSLTKNDRFVKLKESQDAVKAFLQETRLNKGKKIIGSVSKAITKMWPELTSEMPELLRNNPAALSAKLTTIKHKKGAQGYRREIKKSIALLPQMRNKTEARKVFVQHPNLFRYLTVDIVDKLVFNPKEFVYVIKQAKPRAMSEEIVQHLESATFLRSIMGDIRYTKTLTRALALVKTKHGKDTDDDVDSTTQTQDEDKPTNLE